MSHLHWPVEVITLDGKVVNHICDECFEAFEFHGFMTDHDGEIWALYPSHPGGERFFIGDPIMRNREGKTFRLIVT